MRFVIAIVMFVAAAAMIAVGIVQRTVFAPPDAVVHTVEVTGGAPVTVIDGAVLNAVEGRQTITVTGSGPIVAAYGRTIDVVAWVGDATHAELGFDEETGELVSTLVRGSTSTVPDPYGSDLWLDDYRDEDLLRLAVTVPEDVSFVITSDGQRPAPATIELSWPVTNTQPMSGWLIVLGGGVLVVGLVVLLWAIHHMRSTRGPRRRMPKVPRQKPVKPARTRPLARVAAPARAGAAALAAAAALVGGVLAGPSAATATQTPTPTPTPSPEESRPVPAVTNRQIARIVERIRVAIAEADAAGDATLAEARLTGPALELRASGYAILAADSSLAVDLPTIPENGNVVLALPQQIPADGDAWPRSVLAVVASPSSEEEAPAPSVALVLTQASARDNYKAAYFVTLQSDVPEVAETAIGAAKLPPDTPLLSMRPDGLAEAYADVLTLDKDSEFFRKFDLSEDSLVTLWGKASMDEIRAGLPAVAQAAFATAPGTASILSLATFDAGGIVAVDLVQTVTVTPVEEGATVSPSGSVKALSGVETSGLGVAAAYGAQLLFAVPPLDSSAPIVLLGYSQGLVSAKEVQ